MKTLKVLLVVLTVVTIMNIAGISASSINNIDTITNLEVPKFRGNSFSTKKYLDVSEMGGHHKLKEISASGPLDARVVKFVTDNIGHASVWLDIHNKTSITLTNDLQYALILQGGTFAVQFRTRAWEIYNVKVNRAVWYLQI